MRAWLNSVRDRFLGGPKVDWTWTEDCKVDDRIESVMLHRTTRRVAVFSPDGKYRYVLSVTWRQEGPVAVFIGLNPSTADAFKDDPTILACRQMADCWGLSGIIMANLFAWRSTDPKGLLDTASPVGVFNSFEMIRSLPGFRREADPGSIFVAAWGAIHTQLGKRGEFIVSRGELAKKCIPQLYRLGLTQEGFPRHPLFMVRTTVPEPFNFNGSYTPQKGGSNLGKDGSR